MKVPPKEKKTPELAGLQTLTAILAESGDLDTILRRSLAGILKLLGLPTGRICLQDEGKNRFVTRTSRGIPRAIAPLLGPFRKGEGFFGRTARLGRPCLIPDLLKERKRRKVPPEVIEAGYRFFYSVPLSHHGEVLGRLELYSRKPAALSEFDRGLVVLFTNHLGCTISRTRLVDKMARDISDRKGAETELTDQVIQAQEAERKRIARELHDEVGQALTGIRINLSLIEKAVEVADGLDRRPFESLYELIDETLENVSRLSYDLRPAMLDDLGLPIAIQWYCRNFRERTGIRAILTVRGKLDSLPDRIGTYLYRFLQESLTNVARHAKARTVRVTVTHAGRHISIRVTDDGSGFDPLRVLSGRELRTGQGLFGLRGRTEILGGKMEIVSQEGKGTTLTARIPSER